MKQNIECPKCGAQMERKEHPERDVCPYCDTIVYPEKREVATAPLPPPPSQHIYIHMPGVVTPLKEEPKETSWQMEEEVSVNNGNEEEEDNGGSGHTIFIIVIIVVLLLFGMLI